MDPAAWLWDADPPNQHREARIVADAVPRRIHLEEYESRRPFGESLLEGGKGTLAVAQLCVQPGDVQGRDVTLPRESLEVAEGDRPLPEALECREPHVDGASPCRSPGVCILALLLTWGVPGLGERIRASSLAWMTPPARCAPIKRLQFFTAGA